MVGYLEVFAMKLGELAVNSMELEKTSCLPLKMEMIQ